MSSKKRKLPLLDLDDDSEEAQVYKEKEGDGDGDDEDDYLTMSIPEEKPSTGQETYSQKRARIEREQYEKSKSKQKSQKEEEEDRRKEALSRSIISEEAESKGLRMMKMMGFTPGSALGAPSERKKDSLPIEVDMKIDRGGIGRDTEQKEKIRSIFEENAALEKQTQHGFRLSVREEQELRRTEGRLFAAQRTAESMSSLDASSVPLKSIPVVWRGLVAHRLEKHQEKEARQAMMDDAPDRESKEEEYLKVITDIEEDTELEDFEAQPVGEQLEQLLDYLRDTHYYCFWCGCAYDSRQDLDISCPGKLEDDH